MNNPNQSAWEARLRDIVTNEELTMEIKLPEGTLEATVSGTGASAIDLFMLYKATKAVLVQIGREVAPSPAGEVEAMLEKLCDKLRKGCMDVLKEEKVIE